MATPTVVLTNLTEWSDADATSGWTSDDSVTSFSGFQREGSACNGMQASQGASHMWASGSTTDLTGQRVYVWMQLHGAATTKANGGFRIVLGDDTNRIAYYVGGSDDFGFQAGAWACFVLDIDNRGGMGFATLAGSEASLDVTAITEIGGGMNNTAKALGSVDNAFVDIVRYGTGLIVYGGTSGDPITLSELAADDASAAAGKAYGIIREIQSGVFGVQGDIIFGDAGGTNDIWWEDENVVVVIEDHIHGTGTPTTMAITIVGNASASNQHVEWGIAVGSGDGEQGRNGVFWRNANLSQPLTFDASDADLDDFLMYGGGFDGFVATAAGQDVVFSADATLGPTHHLSGVTFSRCGQVDIGTVVTRNTTFTGHTGTDAALLWNEDINIKNCAFIANTDGTNDPAGIEHPSSAGSPYAYDGLTFSGNDNDAYNSSGSTIDVNLTNDSNATTSRGNTVNFLAAFTHTVTGLSSGERVVWFRVSDDALLESQPESGGEAQYSYNYAGDVSVYVQILSLNNRNKSPIVVLSNDNSTLPAALATDPFYDNP
jgi:hypothetical protein